MIDIRCIISKMLFSNFEDSSKINITGFGSKFADLSIRFQQMPKPPEQIKEQLLENTYINDVDFINGFFNITLSKVFYDHIQLYHNVDKSESNIIVEFFSPNIYTQIDLRILRNIYIGDSICNFLQMKNHSVESNALVTNQGLKNNKFYALREIYPNKSIKSLRQIIESNDESFTELYANFEQEVSKRDKSKLDVITSVTDESISQLQKSSLDMGANIDKFIPFSELEHFQFEIISILSKLGFNEEINFSNGKSKQIYSANGQPTYLIKDIASLWKRYIDGAKVIYLVLAEDQKSHVKYLKELVKILDMDLQLNPVIHSYAKIGDNCNIDLLYKELNQKKGYQNFDDFCNDLKLFMLSVDENKTLSITSQKVMSFKLLYNLNRIEEHLNKSHCDNKGDFCNQAKKVSNESFDVISRIYNAQKSLRPSHAVQAMLKYSEQILHIYESKPANHLFNTHSKKIVEHTIQEFKTSFNL